MLVVIRAANLSYLGIQANLTHKLDAADYIQHVSYLSLHGVTDIKARILTVEKLVYLRNFPKNSA